MNNAYSIQILDGNNKSIGELMTASPSDILKYINKGFKVIDKSTGSELTESFINSTIGVSDGIIDVSC